uniref:Uncharacterized protein n=1 Tax=Seriola lalandi dorsalis TaxID=1841481 RepID=A0A3B4X4A3_SERLL
VCPRNLPTAVLNYECPVPCRCTVNSLTQIKYAHQEFGPFSIHLLVGLKKSCEFKLSGKSNNHKPCNLTIYSDFMVSMSQC